jgi:hypothetical protein
MPVFYNSQWNCEEIEFTTIEPEENNDSEEMKAIKQYWDEIDAKNDIF